MRSSLLELVFSYLIPAAAIALAIIGSYEEGLSRDGLVALANGALLTAAIFARHPVLVRLEVMLVASSLLNLASHFVPLEPLRMPCATVATLAGPLWLRFARLLNRESSIAALGFAALMVGWASGVSLTGTLGYTVGAALLATYALVDYICHRHFISLYWLFLNGWFLLVGIRHLVTR